MFMVDKLLKLLQSELMEELAQEVKQESFQLRMETIIFNNMNNYKSTIKTIINQQYE